MYIVTLDTLHYRGKIIVETYPQLTNLDGLYFVNSNCLENSFMVENKNKMSRIAKTVLTFSLQPCQYSFDFGNEQKCTNIVYFPLTRSAPGADQVVFIYLRPNW